MSKSQAKIKQQKRMKYIPNISSSIGMQTTGFKIGNKQKPTHKKRKVTNRLQRQSRKTNRGE